MQSPLYQAGPIEPFRIKTDVQDLEKLLDRIFGDEIEKTLEPGESNLIEFPQSPFKAELVKTEAETNPPALAKDDKIAAEKIHLAESVIDCRPELISDDAPLKSIIDEDDYQQDKRLHEAIEVQRQELIALRRRLSEREHEIRLQKIELAANADQLKYMPELFNKALQVNELDQKLKDLQLAFESEQGQHEQSRDLLYKAQARVDNIKNSVWFKFGRFLGFNIV